MSERVIAKTSRSRNSIKLAATALCKTSSGIWLSSAASVIISVQVSEHKFEKRKHGCDASQQKSQSSEVVMKQELQFWTWLEDSVYYFSSFWKVHQVHIIKRNIPEFEDCQRAFEIINTNPWADPNLPDEWCPHLHF